MRLGTSGTRQLTLARPARSAVWGRRHCTEAPADIVVSGSAVGGKIQTHTQPPRQVRLHLTGDLEVTVLECKSGDLLLLVRHTWRQRHQMPMDVPVALPTAQTQHVQPVGLHLGHQRLSGGMHHPLHGQILRHVDRDDVFDVRYRRDEQVPGHSGKRLRNATATPSR